MISKTINRPQLVTPPKPCSCCGQGFVAAWGWVFIQPARIVDLCGPCARTMRYGTEARIGRATASPRVGGTEGGMTNLLDGVLRLRAAGLATIPIRADGSKRPPLTTWKPYEERQPTEAELRGWFGNGKQYGVALIGGKVSGNLEVIDFDAPELIADWRALVEEAAAGLLGRLPQVETPTGGLHVLYRCARIAGNQKLAEREVEVPEGTKGGRRRGDQWFKVETTIETRGEGGYVLTAGSPAACHPSGNLYRLTNGDLKAVPTITEEERDILLACAYAFNQHVKGVERTASEKTAMAEGGVKPGEDFNARGDVRALLEKHQWRYLRRGPMGELWQRPGGDHQSATLFDTGALYVFSSNAYPFDHNRAYSPFAVCALLEHSGDFNAAAKALAADGYGGPTPSPVPTPSSKVAPADGETEQASSAYKANGIGMIWLRPVREGVEPTPIRLTNFKAKITGDVLRDDGAESARLYEVTAQLVGEHAEQKGQVTAEEFDSLRWAGQILGARAIVYPGKKEHTATAIRELSQSLKARRVIAHSGWRNDGDGWRYYHAGGAINAEGLVDAEVDLLAPLAPVNLPTPPTGERLREVVRAVAFDLPAAAPEAIMLPLIGAAFAAVLTEADFSAFLFGYTGTGKSELAALVQAFFGRAFHAKNLPGSWSSTANSLEAVAHAAKDCVLVVDDFCPQGPPQEQAKLHAAADRLHRAQGNHSGRMRARTDGTVRPPKPPRGLVISTGEDLPRGQSLRARLAILQVEKDAVRWAYLTLCQKQAREGLYAEAMAAFLQWLATDNRIETLRAGAAERIGALRDEWLAGDSGAHKRSATTLAYLERSWEVWLSFATEAGALDGDEVTGLRESLRAALEKFGEAQDAYQVSESPAPRFIELIRAAITSGKAHVTDLRGGQPCDAEGQSIGDAWGWRDGQAQGERIGWLDGDDLYLQPDAAYKCAQSAAVSGEGLTVGSKTLWKRMDEAGLLAEVDGQDSKTVKKKIGERRPRVLHLKAEKISTAT